MARICVVGAGVIGSSVALHLLQTYKEKQCQVTLIADKFSPDTTSDRSTAFVLPFDVIPPPEGGFIEGNGDLSVWLHDTVSHVRSLHDSPEGGRMGIVMVHGIRALVEEVSEAPWWSSEACGYKEVPLHDRTHYNIPAEYKTVASFSSYVIDSRFYLPKLLEKFHALGGVSQMRKIANLLELKEYDIVINCSGLGAAELVPDPLVYPVRGDVVSVEAPWIKQFVILESEGKIRSITPRVADVLIGVTAIPNEYNSDPSPSTKEQLMKDTTNIMPSLKTAKILETWVGLRPMRSKVRLCRDLSYHSNVVIHCYGHGSKGVCYHWGCALEVGRLVHDSIVEKFFIESL